MPHILQVNQLKQWTCPQSPGLQTTGWKLTLHLLGTHHYFLQPWRMLLGFLRVIQRDYTRKRTVPMETTENMFTICSDMWYLSSILSSETSNIYAIINFKLCDTTRVDAEDPDTPLTIALRQLWPPSAQCFSHMCTEKNHREGLPAEILFPVGLGQAWELEFLLRNQVSLMLWVFNLTLSSPGLLDSSNTLPSTSSVFLETEGQDLWCTLLESAFEMEAAECNRLQSLVICRQRARCESQCWALTQWVRNGCLVGAFILLYQGGSGKPSEMFSLAVLWIYNNLVLWVLLALDYILFLMTQQIFTSCLQVHDMVQGVTGIAKIKTENAYACTNWQFLSQLPLQNPTELGICTPLASCLHALPLQQTPPSASLTTSRCHYYTALFSHERARIVLPDSLTLTSLSLGTSIHQASLDLEFWTPRGW